MTRRTLSHLAEVEAIGASVVEVLLQLQPAAQHQIHRLLFVSRRRLALLRFQERDEGGSQMANVLVSTVNERHQSHMPIKKLYAFFTL